MKEKYCYVIYSNGIDVFLEVLNDKHFCDPYPVKSVLIGKSKRGIKAGYGAMITLDEFDDLTAALIHYNYDGYEGVDFFLAMTPEKGLKIMSKLLSYIDQITDDMWNEVNCLG